MSAFAASEQPDKLKKPIYMVNDDDYPVYVRAYVTADPKQVVKELAKAMDIVVDIDIKPRVATSWQSVHHLVMEEENHPPEVDNIIDLRKAGYQDTRVMTVSKRSTQIARAVLPYRIEVAVDFNDSLHYIVRCTQVLPGGRWRAICDRLQSTDEMAEEEKVEHDTTQEEYEDDLPPRGGGMRAATTQSSIASTSHGEHTWSDTDDNDTQVNLDSAGYNLSSTDFHLQRRERS